MTLVLVVSTVGESSADTFAARLANKRLILSGAHCSGLEFLTGTDALWHNEIPCLVDENGCLMPDQNPLEGRVQWIDDKTFMFVETDQAKVNNQSPPRNWIYVIRKFENDLLEVDEPWTGWGKNDVTKETFRVVSREMEKSAKQKNCKP